MKLEWEKIACCDGGDTPYCTERLGVWGGWIVKNYTIYNCPEFEDTNISESMVFIPDPKHEWEIDNED